MQVVFCGIGILLVGIGVSLEVTANVATLAGEGMVLAICRVFPVKFSNAKVGVDGTLVLLACIFSLVLGGRIVGVREGTVAAAILVGLIAKQVNKPMQRFAQQHLETVV